jgi:hypothetical protein
MKPRECTATQTAAPKPLRAKSRKVTSCVGEGLRRVLSVAAEQASDECSQRRVVLGTTG